MRKISVFGLLAAIGLMAASEGAYAQPNHMIVDCSNGNVFGLSDQFASGGAANTIYLASGPCVANFEITQNNITIDGFTGSLTLTGPVSISGATNIILEDLTINDGNTLTPVVLVTGSASVVIRALFSTPIIQNQTNVFDGVFADGPALVQLQGAAVQNNGGIGLHARGGARIESINGTVTGNTGGGVLAEQGSSALIQGSTITADVAFNAGNPLAVIMAERSSTITLAGGNTITNMATGGAAALVSGGATLFEENGTADGFVATADTVNGDGRVNTQSVIELGAASGGGGITWNGNVFVSQFSSFRADGENVTITGTLSLGQAGNAYFNETKGTSNNIAHVVCQSITDHVANPTLVTPNVTIGAPPSCAAF